MSRDSIPEPVNGMPDISGRDHDIEARTKGQGPVFLGRTQIRAGRVRSAFGVALHMHQPLILSDEGNLRNARLIGNLQYMMDNQHIHGNHDAPAYASCYSRIADFIRELVDAGRQPRVMLDYSGTLLFGLRQMGRQDILANLKTVVENERYWPCVEWLGTFWGHAVAASTPVPDFKLQIRAWQTHFASVFGWEALGRIRGFSPPEMSLPNHPDVSYEYVRALRECGYRWLLVQEHSVEEIDGGSLRERYLPRKLVTRNSGGRETSITALIKTQGSDTKLVGQMQPFYEAKGQHPRRLNGRQVPPLVLQISDGENGGVMMNEFPGNYRKVWHETATEGVAGLNGTEYLELFEDAGISEAEFAPVRPIHQHALWSRVGNDPTPDKVARAVDAAQKADSRFHMEGGSWTSNLSWVRDYPNVLDPMNRLSARFHQMLSEGSLDPGSDEYRSVLLYLLTSQTSCYRYWGQGRWTDYAREICRRGEEILSR